MPTGYTAAIEKGISFKEFALNCARAFGACIMMRDEPSDAPIPEEFEPSDYNAKSMEGAHARIAMLKAMTREECALSSHEEFLKSQKYHLEGLEKDRALEEKYNAMLTHAEAWNPPTPDHQGLKKFMIEQVKQGLKFDCGGTYHKDALRDLEQFTSEDWRRKEIDACLLTISSSAKLQAEENKRTTERTNWIKQLRSSL